MCHTQSCLYDSYPLPFPSQIYMCACSYYALFKINIDNKYFQFNYNKLVAGATTGAALMQARGRRGVAQQVLGS